MVQYQNFTNARKLPSYGIKSILWSKISEPGKNFLQVVNKKSLQKYFEIQTFYPQSPTPTQVALTEVANAHGLHPSQYHTGLRHRYSLSTRAGSNQTQV